MNIATLFETLLNPVVGDGRSEPERAAPSFWRRLARRRKTHEIETALRASLAAGSFSLHYQPIFDQSGRIVEAEALLRAQDPLLRRIGPSEYIPIAEETGLILPIGDLVLRMACDRLSEWHARGIDSVHLAVNVSCIQMVNPGFAERVLRIFSEHGISPHMLHLELTETTLLRDTPPLVAQMRLLSEAGVAFSIDDFGTGYSTLERLSKLPISTMKVDQSFVRELGHNRRALGIVQAMVCLAGQLDLDLIAEGVESAEQMAILAAVGCHKFQGHYLGQPMAAEDILALMLKSGNYSEESRSGGSSKAPPPDGLSEVA